MSKKAFVTKEMIEKIVKDYPTPFHIYDEKGIRENAQAVKEAFAWNKGFKEYFAVKATPNPYLMQILKEYGCGCDCSSMTELMLSKAIGVEGSDIMFSSNETPAEEYAYAAKLGAIINSSLIVYLNSCIIQFSFLSFPLQGFYSNFPLLPFSDSVITAQIIWVYNNNLYNFCQVNKMSFCISCQLSDFFA